MEIKYSQEDLKSLIKSYYLEKEGREVEVIIEVKKELVGFYSSMTGVTTVSLCEEITMLGKKVIGREEIKKDKISSILSELLESAGYTLDGITFDEGVNTVWKGSYMNEYQDYEPYFKGVRLNVSKNSLVKKM